MKIRLLIPLLALACGSSTEGDTSAKSGADDTGSSDTAGDSSSGSGVAGLAALSSDDCPDLSTSGTTSFVSSGRDRTVTAVVPSTVEENMPIVFFFHGLLDASTSSPSAMMASGLSLQSYADQLGLIFVLPESDLMSVGGFSFYMWTVDTTDGEDIILYDDLRTCASDQLGIDLDRVSAMGFSGGGLFTTVVARDRGDTLASIVELSGGSDVTIPTFTGLFAEYDTPAYAMPALLMAGGANDVWPGGGVTLVDFSAATDKLQGQLNDDGHFVVRCEHTQGHYVPPSAVTDSWAWIEAHRFGEPSPFIASGIDVLTTGCDLVTGD
jgi:predicted esterase